MSFTREVRPDRLIDENGRRTDGRLYNELRPVKLKVGVLGTADGSAYIEQGKTRIIVAVYGPRELHPRHLALSDKAYLRCTYRMATFSVPDRKNPAPTRREREISMVVANAIEPVIFIRDFPRAVIDIYIQVLQADGGTRAAAITAAAIALADAGIPMRNLVTAVAVGKADGQIVLDLNDKEDKYGEGDIPIAMIPGTDQITLLQQDGKFTVEEFKQAMELAKSGIAQLYELQKEAIRNAYKVAAEEKTSTESEEPVISEPVTTIPIEKTEEESELSKAIRETVSPAELVSEISTVPETPEKTPTPSEPEQKADTPTPTEDVSEPTSTAVEQKEEKSEPETETQEPKPSESAESIKPEEAS